MSKRVIVIGSGLSGVSATRPLVEAGVEVIMLDVGMRPEFSTNNKAALSFEDFRRSDPMQYETFLGSNFSGLQASLGTSGHAGAMTSGRRAHVVRDAERLLPIHSEAITTQSLAQGGLSEAWGGVCAFFNAAELEETGLPADMQTVYRNVVEQIGVSGPQSIYNLQPPARLDTNSELLIRSRGRAKLSHRRMKLEQPALALLTRDKGSRQATAYRDMDFWDDAEGAVYRARYTLEELQKHPNFTYLSQQLVTDIEEKGHVRIVTRDVPTGEEYSYEADAVIVAAGALNTTRLLLRSFKRYDTPTPVILKDNYIIACVLPRALGVAQDPDRHSLCQLVIEDEEAGVYAQLYSYRSLLLYKLLRYVPLPTPQALAVLSALAPALMLVDVRFSSRLDTRHFSVLHKNGEREHLKISYPDTADLSQRNAGMRRIKRALRTLGLVPLYTSHNPYGATSHYAGGVLFSERTDEFPLSADSEGRLYGSKNIYVADSATWRSLPAKPPGLTLMANALRIGSYVRDFT